MPTDPNTDAACGRTRIARHKAQGSAGLKFVVSQSRGDHDLEVPLAPIAPRSIRLGWWLSSFAYSNLKSRSSLVVWSVFALAIGALAVTTVRAKNPGIDQTAATTTKIVVVADAGRQPPVRQEIAQNSVTQRAPTI